MREYNTAVGIASYLIDLDGLNRLRADRTAAGYGRKERLDEFCILGRWYTDSCGNFAKMIGPSPADLWHKNPYAPDYLVPKVMTKAELLLVMRGESFGYGSDWSLPPSFAKCTRCGTGWTLEDAHQMFHANDDGRASLEAFVGQPFADVREIPELTGKSVHFVDHDMVLNAAYKGADAKAARDGTPWRYVGKDYVVEPGDMASLQIARFTHPACAKVENAERSRAEMEAIFSQGGFGRANLIAIENEYWRDGSGSPWYLVQVGEAPVIKIGWRKRVISIDWSASKTDLAHLFESEDVTKSEHMIHAWSPAKASEYLTKIVPAISNGVHVYSTRGDAAG